MTACHIPEDRDDVREVERHGGHREDSVHSDGAREVEETREDRDDGDEADRAQRGLRPRADVAEVAAVGEALVTAERIHRARNGLEGGLADEERGEADEHLQRGTLVDKRMSIVKMRRTQTKSAPGLPMRRTMI